MHEIEIRSTSLEEARKAAAFQLGVSEEQISVEIVEEPREVSGELGGTYRVRARLRDDAFSPHAEEAEEAQEEAGPTEAAEAEKPTDDVDFSRYSLSGSDEAEEVAEAKEIGEEPAIERAFSSSRQTSSAQEEPSDRPVQHYFAEYDEEEEEEEGEPNVEVAEKARAFLQGLLPLLGVEAEAVVRYTGAERVLVELVGPDLGLLIGRYGSTLDAIQLLTAAAGNNGVEQGARITVDAENYRDRRRESLESLAASTAAKVKRSGREVVLSDLKASERRIIHLSLRDDPDVETYSEGEGRRRRLVVGPRRAPRDEE